MARESTCFWIEKRCPRCGSQLASDGRYVWCTFVGGEGRRPCSYGIDKKVRVEEVK